MNQIIAHSEHALVNVLPIVFMDATLSALVCAETLVQEAVKNHACTHVREHVETVAETVVSLHVLEIVAVLVLGHRFNHVKTALVHVHLPAKAVVVPLVQQVVNLLVKMVAKALVVHHVQEVVIRDAARAAIKDVRVHVIAVVLVLAIQVVRKLVKMDVKEHAKAIALDRVPARAKIHVKELVIVVAILHVWDPVKGCVCTVADGVVQAFSIIRIIIA